MHPTDPVVRTILERSMVARLATVSRAGRPHVNPIYFVLADGRIRLGTTTATLAARNVAADPRVQVLFEVESDQADRRILRVAGEARVITDRAALRDYKRRNGRKYFRSLRGLWMSVTHLRRLYLTTKYLSSSKPGSGHCIIEIEPRQVELLDRHD